MDCLHKLRIKACFNKAWKSYDGHCSVQKHVCKKAIELLGEQGLRYDTIADFACGTSVSTQLLQSQLVFKALYAIDFSERLLEVAKRKTNNRNIHYILADFDSLIFESNYLDLAFCNMGLQWSANLGNTLNTINGYLRRAGILAFTIPMVGTFEELKGCKNALYNYAEIVNILQRAGYDLVQYQDEIIVEQFGSHLDAVRSIKSVGANYLMRANLGNQRGLTRDNIKDYFHARESISLTYRVGIFVAKKLRRTYE
jgi:malonyl-CoA O-methyltransferase